MRTWQVAKEIEDERLKEEQSQEQIKMSVPTDLYTKEKFKEWCEKNNYTMSKYIRNHMKQVCGLL